MNPGLSIPEAMAEGSKQARVNLTSSDYYNWRREDPEWKKLTDEHAEQSRDKLRHSSTDIYHRVEIARMRAAKMAAGELRSPEEFEAASKIISAKWATDEEKHNAAAIILEWKNQADRGMTGQEIGAFRAIQQYDPAAKNVTQLSSDPENPPVFKMIVETLAPAGAMPPEMAAAVGHK